MADHPLLCPLYGIARASTNADGSSGCFPPLVWVEPKWQQAVKPHPAVVEKAMSKAHPKLYVSVTQEGRAGEFSIEYVPDVHVRQCYCGAHVCDCCYRRHKQRHLRVSQRR